MQGAVIQPVPNQAPWSAFAASGGFGLGTFSGKRPSLYPQDALQRLQAVGAANRSSAAALPMPARFPSQYLRSTFVVPTMYLRSTYDRQTEVLRRYIGGTTKVLGRYCLDRMGVSRRTEPVPVGSGHPDFAVHNSLRQWPLIGKPALPYAPLRVRKNARQRLGRQTKCRRQAEAGARQDRTSGIPLVVPLFC